MWHTGLSVRCAHHHFQESVNRLLAIQGLTILIPLPEWSACLKTGPVKQISHPLKLILRTGDQSDFRTLLVGTRPLFLQALHILSAYVSVARKEVCKLACYRM